VYPTFIERKSVGIHSHCPKLEDDNVEKHGIEIYVADANCKPTVNIQKNQQTVLHYTLISEQNPPGEANNLSVTYKIFGLLWFPKFNDPIHNNIPTDACEPDESL
jgi:hypothetical protein